VRKWIKNLFRKGWGRAQVPEHLPSKHKALSSNSTTTKTILSGRYKAVVSSSFHHHQYSNRVIRNFTGQLHIH
jgi:hypothetical protein